MLFRAIAKFSRYDGIVYLCGASSSTPVLGNFVCTISVFIPIENPHLTIVHFGTLCGFTLNQLLTSVLCPNIKCVSEPRPNGFPYFPDASDLCSAPRWRKNYIWIMLQKILLSKQALRVLPPPTFQEYLLFRGTQPVIQLSEQLAAHRPGPDDVSESQ